MIKISIIFLSVQGNKVTDTYICDSFALAQYKTKAVLTLDGIEKAINYDNLLYFASEKI